MSKPTPLQTGKTRIKKYDRSTRRHWYMATVEAHYIVVLKDGEEEKHVKQIQRMNAIVQSPGREIVAKTLEDIRTLVFMRAESEYGIAQDKLADYIILNMSYMGHMTEHDHFTKFQPKEDIPLRPGEPANG